MNSPEAYSDSPWTGCGGSVKQMGRERIFGKVKSLPLGALFGLGIGLLLAYGVAAMQPPGRHYYFAIMLPGGMVGTIIGYATQRFGQPTTRLRSSKV